jgi:hypothetical protein
MIWRVHPPCDPRAERFAARAHLTVDISQVLPYLLQCWWIYLFAGRRALTWKKAA